MSNQDITNQELLGAINQSFGEIETKIDKRFDSVDKRLEALERGMEEVKLKFAYVAWAIDAEAINKRLVEVEKKVGIKAS